jgi:protein-ribulosamine 3-kinase
VHGPSEDLQELLPSFYEKVIPRLLRPLQTSGKKLKPVLVHGDIWYGNIATNAKTDAPIMFDSSVSWAHNECKLVKAALLQLTPLVDELNYFNIPRYRLGRQWMREYHKHFPISPPKEDYEDRNRLYAM